MIRKLTAKDVTAFQSLRLSALEESPEAFAASHEDEATLPVDVVAGRIAPGHDPSTFVLGAFTPDGELAGVLGFYQETPRKMRHVGVFWGMYVSPGMRRHGIARELVAQAIREAERIDELRQITLTVNAVNVPARRLYESLGFRRIGIMPGALRWRIATTSTFCFANVPAESGKRSTDCLRQHCSQSFIRDEKPIFWDCSRLVVREDLAAANVESPSHRLPAMAGIQEIQQQIRQLSARTPGTTQVASRIPRAHCRGADRIRNKKRKAGKTRS